MLLGIKYGILSAYYDLEYKISEAKREKRYKQRSKTIERNNLARSKSVFRGGGIFNLINSSEIQEYYRKNISLSVEQQISIIVNCYKSLDDKLELLKKLYYVVTEAEKEKVQKAISRFENYKTLFYNPETIYPGRKMFYVVERQILKRNIVDSNSPKELFDKVTDMTDYFDSITDVMEYINAHDDQTLSFSVNLISFLGRLKHNYLAGFSVLYINGKFRPYRCYLAEEMFEDNDNWDHIDLPFEHGCRVKIKVPIMEEPYYGVLWREKDGNGCWYNFLYPDGTDVNEEIIREGFIDLSYPNIEVISGYSVLDWLERA